jgi:hypothetical protein
MSGEPEPADGPDKVSRALLVLTGVWLGLVAALLFSSAVMAVVVVVMDEPILDIPTFAYWAMVLVPIGLVGAFVRAPMVAPMDPEQAGREWRDPSGENPWEGTPPDDPYYWLPAYVHWYWHRVGWLFIPAMKLAAFFLLTANWVDLGGVAVLVAALLTLCPSRAKYDAWLDEVRQRHAGELGN